jgi:Lipid A 3-O-deacylase (PagL)
MMVCGALLRASAERGFSKAMPDPRRTCACGAALLVLLGSAGARAAPATSFGIATGQYGMRAGVPHALGIELQVRTPWRWTLFRPVAGLLTSSAGGAYVYSGLAIEIELPLALQLTPGFAPGIALGGMRRDLGYPIEFRSSLELSVAAGDHLRVGVGFSHVSNARLGDHNPGVEVLVLGIEYPAKNEWGHDPVGSDR